jgi:hypothetical protein
LETYYEEEHCCGVAVTKKSPLRIVNFLLSSSPGAHGDSAKIKVLLRRDAFDPL